MKGLGIVNIYDIAKEAGVSIATVSRVLNKRGTVKKETEDRINKILDKYGYQPSAVARGLVTKSMRTIGIITVDMRVVHYANTVYVLEQRFSQLGYNVMVCNTGGLLSENLRYLRTMVEKNVDGLVLVGSVFGELVQSAEAMEYLKRMPVVLANGSLPLPNAFSVLVDDQYGIRIATQHLLDKGHRKIYYVQDMDTNSAQRKVSGFREAMQTVGIPADEFILHCEYGLEGGKQLAAQILARKLDCTGIVFGEDLTAIGVMKELIRSGIRIPEDIAIIGYNNSEYGRVCTPELTSIDNHFEVMGEYSARLMNSLLQKDANPVDITIRPSIVERSSC